MIQYIIAKIESSETLCWLSVDSVFMQPVNGGLHITLFCDNIKSNVLAADKLADSKLFSHRLGNSLWKIDYSKSFILSIDYMSNILELSNCYANDCISINDSSVVIDIYKRNNY